MFVVDAAASESDFGSIVAFDCFNAGFSFGIFPIEVVAGLGTDASADFLFVALAGELSDGFFSAVLTDGFEEGVDDERFNDLSLFVALTVLLFVVVVVGVLTTFFATTVGTDFFVFVTVSLGAAAVGLEAKTKTIVSFFVKEKSSRTSSSIVSFLLAERLSHCLWEASA